MRAKGYGLDQVYDVRALRVVVDSKLDCYEVLREVCRMLRCSCNQARKMSLYCEVYCLI